MQLDMDQRKKGPVARPPRHPAPKLFIGEWLRRLGLSQVKIAKAVGIGESHMSLIIKGDRYPSAGVLAAIADAMNLPESSLKQPPPSQAVLNTISEIDPALLARLLPKKPN